jgi:hypothetical protein
MSQSGSGQSSPERQPKKKIPTTEEIANAAILQATNTRVELAQTQDRMQTQERELIDMKRALQDLMNTLKQNPTGPNGGGHSSTQAQPQLDPVGQAGTSSAGILTTIDTGTANRHDQTIVIQGPLAIYLGRTNILPGTDWTDWLNTRFTTIQKEQDHILKRIALCESPPGAGTRNGSERQEARREERREHRMNLREVITIESAFQELITAREILTQSNTPQSTPGTYVPPYASGGNTIPLLAIPPSIHPAHSSNTNPVNTYSPQNKMQVIDTQHVPQQQLYNQIQQPEEPPTYAPKMLAYTAAANIPGQHNKGRRRSISDGNDSWRNNNNKDKNRPYKYAGPERHDILKWMNFLESYMDEQRVTSDQKKCDYMMTFITDDIATQINTGLTISEDATEIWPIYKNWLLTTYKRDPERIQTSSDSQFESRKQGPNESIDDYLDVLKALRMRAHPDESTQIKAGGKMSDRDYAVYNKFLTTLHDPELLKIMDVEFRPLAQAGNYTLLQMMTFCHSKISVLSRYATTKPKTAAIKTVRKRAVSVDTEEEQSQGEGYELDDVVAMVRAQAWNNQNGGQQNRNYTPNTTQTNGQKTDILYTKAGAVVDCYTCRGNHFNRKCPLNPENKKQNQPPNQLNQNKGYQNIPQQQQQQQQQPTWKSYGRQERNTTQAVLRNHLAQVTMKIAQSTGKAQEKLKRTEKMMINAINEVNNKGNDEDDDDDDDEDQENE